MTTPLRTLTLAAVFLAASIYLPILLGGSAPADPCDGRPNDTTDELLECVTLDGVRAHQAALQAIADAHNGNRLTGTSGYEASVAYVAETLTAAGYTVVLDPFPFRFVPPPLLPTTHPGCRPAPRFPLRRHGDRRRHRPGHGR